MTEFFAYLKTMGGLHDALVQRFVWEPSARRIEFGFEDLYTNFAGMPEYPGKQPGVIVLRGVTNVTIDIDSSARLRVFEFMPQEGTSDVVSVRFSPSGRIDVCFEEADYPDCRLVIR